MELAETTTFEQLLEPLVVLQPGLRLERGAAKACLSVSNRPNEIDASWASSLIFESAYESKSLCCAGPLVGRNSSFTLSLKPIA
jgi:hypothetical protein